MRYTGNMSYISDSYKVYFEEKEIGYYETFSDHTVSYSPAWGCPRDMEDELKKLGLDHEIRDRKPLKLFTDLIREENRVPGRKRIIYQNSSLTLERIPKPSDERYSVYRRNAEDSEADYSPLPHDAPHYEGPGTPEGMREWASWYAFNKMDDGTYEAELDEAWWWGGGHNDGGTIRNEIPEEWFTLPYHEFLEHVVRLSAASHYGFTAEMLEEKKGLKEFFGYGSKGENDGT